MGVVMGSASDWPTMLEVVEVLSAFGVAHGARVLSAHRMPDEMFAYGDLWEGGDPDWTIVFEDPHASCTCTARVRLGRAARWATPR